MVAAQNCATEKAGAYTGEVSADMIASTGAKCVILGHSERRSYYGETSPILVKKVAQALESKLEIIFCVGEVLEERETEKHFEVVKQQLTEGLFNLTPEQFAHVVIAYEPVWAIGTGKTATPDQAQEMHAFIRSVVAEKYGQAVADETSILYGGSCNAGNADAIFSPYFVYPNFAKEHSRRGFLETTRCLSRSSNCCCTKVSGSFLSPPHRRQDRTRYPRSYPYNRLFFRPT